MADSTFFNLELKCPACDAITCIQYSTKGARCNGCKVDCKFRHNWITCYRCSKNGHVFFTQYPKLSNDMDFSSYQNSSDEIIKLIINGAGIVRTKPSEKQVPDELDIPVMLTPSSGHIDPHQG